MDMMRRPATGRNALRRKKKMNIVGRSEATNLTDTIIESKCLSCSIQGHPYTAVG